MAEPVRIFHGVEEFRHAAGQRLGVGPWMTMSQERIDGFADITEDWQWIHVDPERARAAGMRGTWAHGYLTLSLIPRLSSRVFDFADIGRAVNYGLERVRFPSPVHPGDRIRAIAEMISTEDFHEGVLGRVRYTIEIDGVAKPACVAEALMVIFPPESERSSHPVPTSDQEQI